jgi:hypothetical protein
MGGNGDTRWGVGRTMEIYPNGRVHCPTVAPNISGNSLLQPKINIPFTYTLATMRKQLDPRIPALINNGVKANHRSFFVMVGDRGRDQVSSSLPIHRR